MKDIVDGCETYDGLTARAGALVHIEGIPFYLAHDTKVLGRVANAALISAQNRPWVHADSQGAGGQGIQIG